MVELVSRKKIIFLGDRETGKTALLTLLVFGTFTHAYQVALASWKSLRLKLTCSLQ